MLLAFGNEFMDVLYPTRGNLGDMEERFDIVVLRQRTECAIRKDLLDYCDYQLILIWKLDYSNHLLVDLTEDLAVDHGRPSRWMRKRF